jgi:hypothetical protein
MEVFTSIPQLADIAIGIRNSYNQPTLQIYSLNSNSNINLPKGITKISIKTENLMLTPGMYSLNLWLGTGDIPLDFHKQCITIEVKVGKIKNNGPLVMNKGYNNLIDAQWDLYQ